MVYGKTINVMYLQESLRLNQTTYTVITKKKKSSIEKQTSGIPIKGTKLMENNNRLIISHYSTQTKNLNLLR